MIDGIRLYLSRQASSFWRYVAEQFMYLLFGWVPTLIGIGLRGVFYRLILQMDGWAAIENRVRLLFADNIKLGNGVYLDQNAYLHACPAGIEIGERAFVAAGSVVTKDVKPDTVVVGSPAKRTKKIKNSPKEGKS